MVDRLTPQQRSRNMQAIRQKDTKPELIVRSMVHKMGFRFRLHAKGLPAKPDLTFPARNKVILVHGCFWHGHDCPDGHIPKSRVGYWAPKLKRNRERDAENYKKLRALGWRVLVIWECETRDTGKLKKRFREFLGRRRRSAVRLIKAGKAVGRLG